MEQIKRCNKCGIEKQIAHFGKTAKNKSGINPQCKDCVNETQNKRNLIKHGLKNASIFCPKYYKIEENNYINHKAISSIRVKTGVSATIIKQYPDIIELEKNRLNKTRL